MESLLSLSLTLIVVLAGCEFFGFSRAFFFRLKDRSERRQAALAALDMMAQDIRRAGQGLSAPLGLGLASGLETLGSALRLERSEKEIGLDSDIQPGQTVLLVKDAQGLKPKRRVCLVRDGQGQVFDVVDIQDKTLIVNPAADFFCLKEEGRLLLMETVDYYLDDQAAVIRRRINDGSGQPLLEEVNRFEFASNPENYLTTVRLAIRPQEEKIYEIQILPKNMAPAFWH